MKRKKENKLLLNKKSRRGFGHSLKPKHSFIKKKQFLVCHSQGRDSIYEKYKNFKPSPFDKIKFYLSLGVTALVVFFIAPVTGRSRNHYHCTWGALENQPVVTVNQAHCLSMKIDHSTYYSGETLVEDGPSHTANATGILESLDSKKNGTVEKDWSGIRQDKGSKKESTFLVGVGSSLSFRDNILTKSVELSDIELRLRQLLQGFIDFDISKIDAFIDFLKNISGDFLKDLNNTVIPFCGRGDKFAYTSARIMEADRNLTLSGLTRITTDGRLIPVSKAELREACTTFSAQNASSKEKPHLYAARVQRFLNYYQKGQAVLDKQQAIQGEEQLSKTIVDELVDFQREASEILANLQPGNFTQRTVLTSAKLSASPQFSAVDFQIYGKPILKVKLNPSLAFTLNPKDGRSVSFGLGKAKLVSFGTQNFGLLVGVDFSARMQYRPEWRYEGLGVKAFIGFGVGLL